MVATKKEKPFRLVLSGSPYRYSWHKTEYGSWVMDEGTAEDDEATVCKFPSAHEEFSKETNRPTGWYCWNGNMKITGPFKSRREAMLIMERRWRAFSMRYDAREDLRNLDFNFLTEDQLTSICRVLGVILPELPGEMKNSRSSAAFSSLNHRR